MYTEFYFENAEELIRNALNTKTPNYFVGINSHILVLKGDSVEVNEQYCFENNIPIMDIPNAGGCIVSSSGDIAVAHLSKNLTDTYCKDVLLNITEYLKSKGLNATYDNNDVLIDNNMKVASGSVKRINDMLYSGIHISMNVNNEAINNICLKQRIKIPMGLSNYGIKTEEMLSILAKINQPIK